MAIMTDLKWNDIEKYDPPIDVPVLIRRKSGVVSITTRRPGYNHPDATHADKYTNPVLFDHWAGIPKDYFNVGRTRAFINRFLDRLGVI